MPKKQRHLTGLILRKLLASSQYAVLGTLLTIRERLQKLRDDFDNQKQEEDNFLAKLVEDDDLEDEYLEEAEFDQEDVELGQSEEPALSKDDLIEEIG